VEVVVGVVVAAAGGAAALADGIQTKKRGYPMHPRRLITVGQVLVGIIPF
jgi:hypothetical protein